MKNSYKLFLLLSLGFLSACSLHPVKTSCDNSLNPSKSLQYEQELDYWIKKIKTLNENEIEAIVRGAKEGNVSWIARKALFLQIQSIPRFCHKDILIDTILKDPLDETSIKRIKEYLQNEINPDDTKFCLLLELIKNRPELITIEILKFAFGFAKTTIFEYFSRSLFEAIVKNCSHLLGSEERGIIEKFLKCLVYDEKDRNQLLDSIKSGSELTENSHLTTILKRVPREIKNPANLIAVVENKDQYKVKRLLEMKVDPNSTYYDEEFNCDKPVIFLAVKNLYKELKDTCSESPPKNLNDGVINLINIIEMLIDFGAKDDYEEFKLEPYYTILSETKGKKNFFERNKVEELEPPKKSMLEEQKLNKHCTVEEDQREGIIFRKDQSKYMYIATQQITTCAIVIVISETYVGFAHIDRTSEAEQGKSLDPITLLRTVLYDDTRTNKLNTLMRSNFSLKEELNDFLEKFATTSESTIKKVILYSPTLDKDHPLSLSTTKDALENWFKAKYIGEKYPTIDLKKSKVIRGYKAVRYDVEKEELSELESVQGETVGRNKWDDPKIMSKKILTDEERYGSVISNSAELPEKLFVNVL